MPCARIVDILRAVLYVCTWNYAVRTSIINIPLYTFTVWGPNENCRDFSFHRHTQFARFVANLAYFKRRTVFLCAWQILAIPRELESEHDNERGLRSPIPTHPGQTTFFRQRRPMHRISQVLLMLNGRFISAADLPQRTMGTPESRRIL